MTQKAEAAEDKRPEEVRLDCPAPEITLTDDDLARFDPLAGQVAGDRYPDMAETAESHESRVGQYDERN